MKHKYQNQLRVSAMEFARTFVRDSDPEATRQHNNRIRANSVARMMYDLLREIPDAKSFKLEEEQQPDDSVVYYLSTIVERP
jgi:hypothetical protein